MAARKSALCVPPERSSDHLRAEVLAISARYRTSPFSYRQAASLPPPQDPGMRTCGKKQPLAILFDRKRELPQQALPNSWQQTIPCSHAIFGIARQISRQDLLFIQYTSNDERYIQRKNGNPRPRPQSNGHRDHHH